MSSALYTRDLRAIRAHAASMKNLTSPVATNLKSLREGAGLSLQKMADRLNMPLSTYRHYEDRFKDPYLPMEMVEKMLTALADLHLSREAILALAAKPASFELAEPVTDYAPGARANVAAILGTTAPAETHPKLKIGSDGTHVQILATVDKGGIDELIRKLQVMKELLD